MRRAVAVLLLGIAVGYGGMTVGIGGEMVPVGLPSFPSVELPSVGLPAVTLPSVDLPSFSPLAMIRNLTAPGDGPLYPPDQRPRVIVVSSDTLRARSIGAYGSDEGLTPEIDRFAAESVVFEDAIAQATWTLPSEMSIHLSQYPSAHGITEHGKQPGNRTFMAQRMRSLGYGTTGLFEVGPNNKSRQMYRPGFDRVAWSHGDDKTLSRFGNRTISVILDESSRSPTFTYILAKTTHDPYGRGVPERIHEAVIEPYDGPLRAFNDLAHTNGVFGDDVLGRIYRNGSEYYLVERYNGRLIANSTLSPRIRDGWFDSPVIQERLEQYNDTHYRIVSRGETLVLDERDIEYVRQQYQAGVRYFDSLFGRFLDRLRQRGLYEDSIIVLTSNHGENVGDHPIGMGEVFGHTFPYEHTVRVPLMIKLPGRGHQVIDDPVELIDLQPTLLQILNGTTGYSRMQGESLLPLIQGQDLDLGYQFTSPSGVRNDTWKYLDGTDGAELYNLAADPLEEHNVAEAHPGILEDLRQRWEDHTIRTARFRSNRSS